MGKYGAKMKTETVELSEKIKIGGEIFSSIILKEPKAAEFGNLNLLDVLQLNVQAISTLAPRISDLTPTHMANMGAADLMAIGGAINNFLVDTKKSPKE